MSSDSRKAAGWKFAAPSQLLLAVVIVVGPAGASRQSHAADAPASQAQLAALIEQLKGSDTDRRAATPELYRMGQVAAPALFDLIADDTAGKDVVNSAVGVLASIHQPELGFGGSRRDAVQARREAAAARREAARSGNTSGGATRSPAGDANSTRPASTQDITRGLRNLPPATRAKAKRATPKLLELAAGPGRSGEAAGLVLGASQPDSKEVADGLAKLLVDRERSTAEHAILGLREMGSTGVLAACAALEEDTRAGTAAWALAEINDPSPKLSSSNTKRIGVELAPDPGLRKVNAAAKAKLKASIPRLIEVLKAKPTDISAQYVCEVLGVIGADSPDAVAAVAERAKSNERAVAALLMMGAPAKSALVELVKTGSRTHTGRAAEQALAKLDARALPGVAENLGAGTYEQRLSAVEKLSAGGPEAVPMLMDAMRTPIPRQEPLESSPFTRAIAKGLKRNREAATAPLLDAIKQSPNAHLRMYAVFMAGELQLKEALPVMRPILAGLSAARADGSPPTGRADIPPSWMRWTLDRSIGAILRDSPDELTAQLADREPAVRTAALRALMFNGQKDAKTVSAIAPLMNDPDPEVAKLATQAMEQRGEDAANYMATAIKTSKNPAERARTARFLGKLAGQRASDTLLDAMNDPDPVVRAAVIVGIRERRNYGPGVTGGRWPEWPPDVVLKALTDDPAPEVRLAAAQSLTELPGPRETAVLQRGIKDADAHVRVACLRGLTRDSYKPAMPELVELVADRDALVRREAVQLLGRGTVAPLMPRLLELARHAEPGPRAAAVTLLGSAGTADSATARSPAAMALLVERRRQASERVAAALGDATPEVRAAAATALARLRPVDAAALHKLAAMTWREADEFARLAAADALLQYGTYANAPWTPAGAARQKAAAAERSAATTRPGRFGATTRPSGAVVRSGVRSGGSLADRIAAAAAAVDAAAPVESPPGIKTLTSELASAGGDGNGRIEAAMALAFMGHAAEQAAPVLANAAESADPNLSTAAVNALTALTRLSHDSPRAMAEALLDPRTGKIRPHVALAWPIPGPTFPGAPTGWTTTTRPSTRPTTRPARPGPTTAPAGGYEVPLATVTAAAKACATALAGRDPEARALAAVTIGRFDPGASVPADALIAALRSRHPAVRKAAMWQATKPGAAVEGQMPTVVATLGDSRIDIATAALDALSRMQQLGDGSRVIGSPEVEARLLDLGARQASGDPAERARAIREAAGYGRTAAYYIPNWRTALADPDPAVRKAAAEALQSMHAALHGGATTRPVLRSASATTRPSQPAALRGRQSP
jgi:HEAT repeat protein